MHLWDAATGRPRATLTGHTETVVSAAFSPDGKTLATGSYDGTVRLWDVATEEVRATLTGHTSPVTAVAFSPDGRSLAAGSDDTMATGSDNISIRIWDVTASRPLATLTEPGRGVRALAFSPDGRSLATGSHRPPAGPRDRNRTRVRLWNVATRGLKATLAADDRGFGSGSALAFSPDGKTLADAGPLSTRLWDVAAERVRTTLADDDITLDAVVFSPDGQSLATAQHESRARLWDLRTGRARFTTPARPSSSSESALAFSPDGALLAVGGHSLGRVFLQDAVTGETLATLTERADPGQATKGSSNSAKPYNPVGSLAFSPDGTTLAAAGTDGKVCLWDVGARKVRAVLTAAATEGGMSVAFSPDGRTLATGSPEGTVRLWDPVTGYPRAALTGHTRIVTAVAFSPDGRTLASGSNDGTVRLWDATLPDPAEIVDTLCRAIRRDFTHPERLLYLTDQQAATGCAT
ncbi:WD40 repeat domain-containing protein [Streptomyces sp. NPDC088261]|uniref:WD40 repeat domain-containing protein n=1 Tax=Streptomyces sp. NPDC088261 TaxID=3365851 RepID=UPI0038307F5B